MALIFGNITGEFVKFNQIEASGATPEEIAERTRKFREIAALDSTYLVYVGMSITFFPLNLCVSSYSPPNM
jgi:hypothetical protein